MKTINIKSKSSCFNTSFSNVTSISYDDNYFAKGGYAKVYNLRKINGKSLQESQVIKIFNTETSIELKNAKECFEKIKLFQERIIEYNRRLKHKNINLIEIGALKALPQFSFEGIEGNKTILGYSANNLDEKEGWILFKKITEGDDDDEIKKNNRYFKQDKFYELSPLIRLNMAYSLVEGFSYLKDMNFIFADLNPQNMFINTNKKQVCLIDYDGGAVMDPKIGYVPKTFGKDAEQDFLAPEIREERRLNQTNNLSNVTLKVNLYTDTWAVAMMIHYLLIRSVHPLFYLKNAKTGKRGVQTESKYLTDKYRWPEIDKNYMNFDKNNNKYYDIYLRLLKKYPDDIKKAMSITFNEGHGTPHRRATYDIWKLAIENVNIDHQNKSSPKKPVAYNVKFYITGGNYGKLTASVDNKGITSGNTVPKGKQVDFIASPNIGYRVKEWRSNSTIVGNKTNNYKITNLTSSENITVEFEPIPITLPLPPVNTGAPTVTRGREQLTVSWASVNDASDYEVWMLSEKSYMSTLVTTVSAYPISNIYSVTITGLDSKTTYYFRIKAKKYSRELSFSDRSTGENPQNNFCPYCRRKPKPGENYCTCLLSGIFRLAGIDKSKV